VLRPEFHSAEWRLEAAERGRIYTTTTPAFLKGTPCLVEALALLRQTHPCARLTIGGPIGEKGVGGYIRAKADRLGVSDAIEYLGYLSGPAIVDNLRRAHVYAIPSHIENSPNNLAEAQAVGVPCVASYAGGIPSMIDHGRTGLLFNVGDAAMLAERLRQLLDDDDLAWRISAESKREATVRHDPAAVTAAHLAACRAVLGQPRA
jgi:glycosyltransferase involved in cell wall biosynthesis